MLIRIAFALFASVPAFAQTQSFECYELLSFTPAATEEPNALYAETAGHWMFERMTNSEPPGFAEFLADNGKSVLTIKEKERQRWIGYFALSEWSRWNKINDRQREAALSAELTKLRPAGGDRGVLAFNGRAQLNALSTANLSRMLKRLDELYPQPEVAPEKLQALAPLEDADFNFLHNAPSELTLSRNPPLISPREMSRLKLNETPSMLESNDMFYASVVGETKSPENQNAVGESQTVGFTLAVSERTRGPYNRGALVPRDSIRLKDDFADQGFVLPAFSSVNQLFGLIKAWAPEFMERQRRSMRFSLPNDVTKDQTSFDKFMDPLRVKTYFPDERLYDTTPIIREALGTLVLNRTDAEVFLRAAFRRFLEVTAVDDYEYVELLKEMKKVGGAQRIWNAQFIDFLKWPDVALRVPVSVPPTAYTIIRKEPLPNPRPYEDWDTSQKPWDSRRLDHTSKP